MKSKLDCDIDDLMDEAHALFLSVVLDPGKTRTLIAKLGDCANDARDAGFTDQEKRLREAAAELEQRLRSP